MSRHGETKKPCPRCGAACPSGRLSNRLCDECERKLAAGEVLIKREAAVGKDGGEAIWVGVPRYWPSVYDAGLNTEHRDALAKAMRDAALASAGSKTWADRHMNWKDYPASKRLLVECTRELRYGGPEYEPYAMTPRVADAIDALDEAVRAACGAAYRAGLEKGSNALYRLAAGDVTLAEFERETVK